MALTTELFPIPIGEEWTPVELDDNYSFDLQNITGRVLEYTYDLPMERGSQLFAGDRLLDNTQDVYIRNLDQQQKGEISIVWDSNA